MQVPSCDTPDDSISPTKEGVGSESSPRTGFLIGTNASVEELNSSERKGNILHKNDVEQPATSRSVRFSHDTLEEKDLQNIPPKTASGRSGASNSEEDEHLSVEEVAASVRTLERTRFEETAVLNNTSSGLRTKNRTESPQAVTSPPETTVSDGNMLPRGRSAKPSKQRGKRSQTPFSWHVLTNSDSESDTEGDVANTDTDAVGGFAIATGTRSPGYSDAKLKSASQGETKRTLDSVSVRRQPHNECQSFGPLDSNADIQAATEMVAAKAISSDPSSDGAQTRRIRFSEVDVTVECSVGPSSCEVPASVSSNGVGNEKSTHGTDGDDPIPRRRSSQGKKEVRKRSQTPFARDRISVCASDSDDDDDENCSTGKDGSLSDTSMPGTKDIGTRRVRFSAAEGE